MLQLNYFASQYNAMKQQIDLDGEDASARQMPEKERESYRCGGRSP